MSPIRADLTVLAPCFYPSPKQVRYLITSAERYQVPIKLYGLMQPYRGWHDVQIPRLYDEIRRITTGYVLYTDASDAIFLSSLNDLWEKYEMMDRPDILLSVENDGEICAGGWMGSKGAAMFALETLADPSFTNTNPQERWREAFKEGNAFGDWNVALDTHRTIFQVEDEPLEVVNDGSPNPTIFNPRCLSWPSVLHFAGGYTDPEIGKAERIEPLWTKLGYPSLTKPR